MKYYNLDPTHYFSVPGLSWDAVLKMTNIELPKISDLDIHLFSEQGMRGSISYASTKYCKANNEFCPDYDDTKPRTEINYDDMNNLYRKSMMQYLPYKDFKWIKIADKNINIELNKKDTSLHGYILEVDMYLPDELHDKQNDFPMAPEKLKVTSDMLSAEQVKDMKKFNIKIGITKKLIPNLFPKKNYITRYKNQKYYIENGWRLTKEHRILEFKQSPWMKPYIDFNTEKRKESTNKEDKNFL